MNRLALNDADAGKLVAVHFDGVCMNEDFWINGQPLGNHPCRYTRLMGKKQIL